MQKERAHEKQCHQVTRQVTFSSLGLRNKFRWNVVFLKRFQLTKRTRLLPHVFDIFPFFWCARSWGIYTGPCSHCVRLRDQIPPWPLAANFIFCYPKFNSTTLCKQPTGCLLPVLSVDTYSSRKCSSGWQVCNFFVCCINYMLIYFLIYGKQK